MKYLLTTLVLATSMPLVAMAADMNNTMSENTSAMPSSTMSDKDVMKADKNMMKSDKDTMKAEKAMMKSDKSMMKAESKSSMGQTSKMDVVEAAAHSNDFKTLTKALKAAGLVETLKGKGPFTIFAPTDAAFAELPKGTLEELLKPENRQKLTQVLTYHVVAGKVPASQVVTMKEAKTVEGENVAITTNTEQQGGTGTVMINNANVIQADINAKNGVIHAIDHVLMPQG